MKVKVKTLQIPSCPAYEGLVVTKWAIVGNKLGLVLAPMAQVLWVYTSVHIDQLEGIVPIGKRTFLMVAGRDHKQYSYKIKNNGQAFAFVTNEILKRRLDVVFGFERGMDDIYKNDINRLIAFSRECAENRRKEMGL